MKTPRRSLVLLLGAVALVAAGITAVSVIDSPDARPGRHFNDKDGTMSIEAAHRPAAPRITGTTIDGKPFDLADHKGKIIVLNAWASWCGPCRIETPMLVDYHNKHKGDGVAVVGLDQDNSAGAGRTFAQEYDITYPNLHDGTGRATLAFPKGVLRAPGVPFTVVIDAKHRVAASSSGEINRKMLDAMVATARKTR
ncbi:TlpA disulfide reductase family protein [Streptomyces huasconensis]|uniref:TlpA disulfide reductase family protein n=1 Tax=Streptomyces huasconensis TaxID=1854574 RepID=A0ABV3LQE7_9ACTN